MKKNFKLVLALVLSVMMIVGNMAVLADGGLVVNGDLQVSGLDNGDKVTYYKVLAWDVDADPVNGWVWGNGVNSTALEAAGLTAASIYGSNDGQNKITAEIAGTLAANLGTAMGDADTVGSNGIWSKTVTDAGLYMVIVEPADTSTIYNPIFVAANWKTDGGTIGGSSWLVQENVMSYSGNGMAKKATIPLTKTATGTDESAQYVDGTDNNSYTADSGETINYSVYTKIPKFGDNYTAPVFALRDTLTGLALTGAPEVYTASGKPTDKKLTPVAAGTADPYKATSGDYWIVSGGKANDTSYYIQFTEKYLDSVAAAGQDIYVEYTAKVTDEAEKIVNQEKNTVDLIFSNKPDDTTGHGRKRDETNHFTFSIDADLVGHAEGNGSSTEAIKVGVDKDGNYIYDSVHYEWSDEWHGPLAGAQFKLYTDSACQNEYSNDVFQNPVYSDSTGRITIKGLDAGDYYLKETQAPAGFIKMQDAVKIEIRADITEEVTVREDVDGVPCTYTTNVLNSYTVKIGDKTTGYTVVNDPASSNKIISSADRQEPLSEDKELLNTKGVELPSTGGIGTTIFYVGGSLLVLAAAILLITKRRMSSND